MANANIRANNALATITTLQNRINNLPAQPNHAQQLQELRQEVADFQNQRNDALLVIRQLERENAQANAALLIARQQQALAAQPNPVPVPQAVPVAQAAAPSLQTLSEQLARLVPLAQRERPNKGDEAPKEECSICNLDQPRLEVIKFHPATAAAQLHHQACVDCLSTILGQGDNCPHCRGQLTDDMRRFIKLQLDLLAADQAARQG